MLQALLASPDEKGDGNVLCSASPVTCCTKMCRITRTGLVGRHPVMYCRKGSQQTFNCLSIFKGTACMYSMCARGLSKSDLHKLGIEQNYIQKL